MIKRILPLLIMLLTFAGFTQARERTDGYCEDGGVVVKVSGQSSTNKTQGSFPGCTITVYLTGTVTLATLYSDNVSTPKANPFTTSPTGDGYWFYYADDNTYDVRYSGGGIVTPFTRTFTSFDNAAVTGAAGVGFQQPGGVATTVQGALNQILAPSCIPGLLTPGGEFGAQITACIAALPSSGGTVDARGITGSIAMTSKVSMSKANVNLLLGCGTYTLSGVSAVQSPFGANFFVTAPNNWIIGTPGCTHLISAAGSRANIVGAVGNVSGGGIRYLELDGNKANNSAQIDDTFQSGIHIISTIAGGGISDSQFTVNRCNIHDHIHYGIVTYGVFSNGNMFTDNWVHDNGKSGDALSTGDGIYLNLASSRNLVQGNYSYGNNRSGLRVSTAGTSSSQNHFVDNWSYSNTLNGFFADEEANVGSVAGQGQSGLVVSGNHFFLNTNHGITLFSGDNVGFLLNSTIVGNEVYSNTQYGVLLQGNASATNTTRQTIIASNQVINNGQTGIYVASNVLDTSATGNTVINNGAGQITDTGTRTINASNKTNITDGNFNVVSPATFAGAVTISGAVAIGGAVAIQQGAGSAVFSMNAVGVRGWTWTCGTNCSLASGDSAGTVDLSSQPVKTGILTSSH